MTTLEGKLMPNINEVAGKRAEGRNVDIASIWRDSRCATVGIDEGEFTSVNEESDHAEEDESPRENGAFRENRYTKGRA